MTDVLRWEDVQSSMQKLRTHTQEFLSKGESVFDAIENNKKALILTICMMLPSMGDQSVHIHQLMKSDKTEIAGLIQEGEVADTEFGDIKEVFELIQVAKAESGGVIGYVEKLMDYFKIHKLQLKLFLQFGGFLFFCIILYAGKEAIETPIIKRSNNFSSNFVNNKLGRVFHVLIAYLFLRLLLSVPGTYDDFNGTQRGNTVWDFIELNRKPIVALEQGIALWYILLGHTKKRRKTSLLLVTALVCVIKLTDQIDFSSPVQLKVYEKRKNRNNSDDDSKVLETSEDSKTPIIESTTDTKVYDLHEPNALYIQDAKIIARLESLWSSDYIQDLVKGGDEIFIYLTDMTLTAQRKDFGKWIFYKTNNETQEKTYIHTEKQIIEKFVVTYENNVK